MSGERCPRGQMSLVYLLPAQVKLEVRWGEGKQVMRTLDTHCVGQDVMMISSGDKILSSWFV